MVPYNEAKRLITTAIFEHAIVYLKGNERGCGTLDDEREHMYIKTLNAIYGDMKSLTNLLLILCDVDNMLRIARYKMY